jgi:hypothetical protein
VSERNRLRLRRTLVLCAALGAGIYVWDEFIKYRLFPKRFGVVVPELVFRSGQISKWVIGDVLERHAIQVVIDLQGHDPHDEHQRAEIEEIRRRGILLKRIPLAGDGTGDLESYAEAVTVLAQAAEAGQPVLVHCGAGAKRTGGVIAVYRVLVEGRSPSAAYAELLDYGWHSDNPTLPRFLNSNMEHFARRLVECGVLAAIPDRLPTIGPVGNENRRRSPGLANDAGLVSLGSSGL